jgi:cytochrome c-type biogenesis protein CcmH/NrfG
MKSATRNLLAAATVSVFAFAAIDAFAAGGGGSMPSPSMPRPDTSPSSRPSPKVQKRETDFQKAEYLIKAEKYDEAIPLLQSVVADNPRDADAWNYLGFASRKLNKNDEALGYYQKALALDPKHKGAHEYLGELHLQMNNLAKAEEQFTILKGLCPTGCEELEDLEADITDYKSTHPTPVSSPQG